MLSEELKEKIWELRQQGNGLLDISIALKISKATVSKWCNYYDPDGKYSQETKVDDEVKQQVIDFYNTDPNISLINKKFKDLLSRGTIRKVLVDNCGYIPSKTKFTPDEVKSNRINSVISWRQDKKIKLVDYKGGKCECCGYNKCIQCLEFHHKDPLQKDFSISGTSYSFDRLKSEVDKCMLVCSNCHKEIHAGFLKI